MATGRRDDCVPCSTLSSHLHLGWGFRRTMCLIWVSVTVCFGRELFASALSFTSPGGGKNLSDEPRANVLWSCMTAQAGFSSEKYRCYATSLLYSWLMLPFLLITNNQKKPPDMQFVLVIFFFFLQSALGTQFGWFALGRAANNQTRASSSCQTGKRNMARISSLSVKIVLMKAVSFNLMWYRHTRMTWWVNVIPLWDMLLLENNQWCSGVML